MTEREKEIIEIWKESIKKTIQIHEKAEDNGMNYLKYIYDNDIECPLCTTSNKLMRTNSKYVSSVKVSYKQSECSICPWCVFKRNVCFSFIDPKTKSYYYDNNSSSIKRLKKWLKVLNEDPMFYFNKIRGIRER